MSGRLSLVAGQALYYLLRAPAPKPRRHKTLSPSRSRMDSSQASSFAHAPLRPQRLQCGCELQCCVISLRGSR